MTSNLYTFEDVVPHTGGMALLDHIDQWGAEHIKASVSIHTASTFADQQGVPAWVGIEYMAQAIAAYAGIQAREASEPVKLGFLIGSRRYHCNCDHFPLGATLQVSATHELAGDNGLSVFRCMISGPNIEAHANLNVFQPDDPGEFLNSGNTKTTTSPPKGDIHE